MKALLSAGLLSIGLLLSCNKASEEEKSVLKKLYIEYHDGIIRECKLHGERVYYAGLNAYDAGEVLYDSQGNKISDCNAAWGKLNAICDQMESCRDVYRVKDNIWGKSELDLYGLSK
jgi:hypothetical protein